MALAQKRTRKQPSKRGPSKAQKRLAHVRKRRIQTALYGALGVLMLGAIVFFLRPFFSGRPADPVALPAAADALYTDSATPMPAATPAPTPEITPEPEPTEEPTPEPTPYVFQTAGRKLSTKKKMIALTFDDGPSTNATGDILDALKKNKAKATFFMLGSRATEHRDLVARVVKEGHQIGTHTHDHKSLIRLTTQEMIDEVAKSIWAIEEAGGGIATILRPPYGNTNETVCDTIHMPMINWSVDTLDWESRNAKQIYNHLLGAKDGDIILMHDLYSTTATAVKKALPALKKKGFQFVTIDELFELRGKDLRLGSVYLSCPPN